MAAIASLLALCAVTAEETHNSSDHRAVLDWVYAPVLSRGPHHWGDIVDRAGHAHYPTCSEGKKQSPINIAGAHTDVNLKPLHFHYNVTASGNYTVRNTQRAIEVVPANASRHHVVDPNLHDREFHLEKIVFHSPSEHALGGGLADLEVQMYHKYHGKHHAAHGEDEEVVVSLLFNAGATPNREFNFFHTLPPLPTTTFEHYALPSKSYAASERFVNESWTFGSLGRVGKYYMYSGSHTAPPCNESVRWYVMQDVGALSDKQLADFRGAMKFDEELAHAQAEAGLHVDAYYMHGNARPVQPRNDRIVHASTDCVDVRPPHPDDDNVNARLSVAGTVLSSLALLMLLVMVVTMQSPMKPHEHQS